MKPIESVPLATWAVEHLIPKPYNVALSGDLLEEVQSGRSIGWYWRQVVFAIGAESLKKSRAYALPLSFSMCWSMLYPAWQTSILRNQFTQSIFDRWSALDWPYSASLEIGSKILPAVTFIWLGFLVYLTLRMQRADEPSVFRILGSMSLSLNVLLVATIALHLYSQSSATYSHHLAVSVPITVSLFSALLSALPPPGNRQTTASFTT